jgi:hypothetical protein
MLFLNPFSWWYIILVIIPFRLCSLITLLPAYPLTIIGLGRLYKKGHYFAWAHLEQFTLQPKDYCKHIKNINSQIISDTKEFIK